jgi:FdhD protein
MTTRSLSIDVDKVADGEQRHVADRVAIEEPLEIRLAWSTPKGRATRSVSITMRTPGNDNELAAGFLYTEGIIHARGDIDSIETCGPPAPESGLFNVVRVELQQDVSVDLGRLQRHFYTTSSCGVCGKTSLDALRVAGHSPLAAGASFSQAALTSVPDSLRSAQDTFDATGGLHAAAVFDKDGQLGAVMEDVGRHNAVDKVIGRMLLDDVLPASDRGMMVSGRASFELVQKTLVAGIPLLAAVSAPSSLAVSLAREFNMTLVGFLRGSTYNVYSAPERLVS